MLDADAPLLPPPDPALWIDPPGSTRAPATLETLHEQVVDYHSFTQLVLPAIASKGTLIVPPDEHVLDAIVRAEGLVEPEAAATHPAAGTVAVVDVLPRCDRCPPSILARYDCPARNRNGRVGWANLCPECFVARGSRRLGTGHGQFLMTLEEVSDEVRAVVEVLTRRHGRESLWAERPGEPEWMGAYRPYGFSGPDTSGRMCAQIFGVSVWVEPTLAGALRVESVRYLREIDFSESDPYLLPMEWTRDEVGHSLRAIFQWSLDRYPVDAERLREDLSVSEARTRRRLDERSFPRQIHDGLPPDPSRPFSFPTSRSLALSDALRCATESVDPVLVRRLVLEWPHTDVRCAATLNPVCTEEVLLEHCRAPHLSVLATILRRGRLGTELIDAIADHAIRGFCSTSDNRRFIIQVATHPDCPSEALPALVDRIKASRGPQRVDLAQATRALPFERRLAIASHLLAGARRCTSTSAIIDEFIGLSPEVRGRAEAGTRLPDAEFVDALTQSPDWSVRRLAELRIAELGLDQALLG